MVDWTEIIIYAIGLIFTAVIVPLAKKLFDLLKAKVQTVQNREVREALSAATREAEDIVGKIVAALQQTVVDDLKEKSDDGKLTPEEIKDLAAKAWGMFKSTISIEAYETLVNHKRDIQAFVQHMIETQVKFNKGF